jgi:hypothetical protein
MLQLSPGFSNVAGPLDRTAQPWDVLTLGENQTFRLQDSVGNTTGTFTADPGHLLSGGSSVNLTFSGGAGPVSLRVATVRVFDDPDSADPDTLVTGSDPWSVTLNFLLQYGTPNYTVQLDADYGSSWNDGTPGRIYNVTGSPYAAPGLVSGTATINNQSPGTYKFALRVTDGAGAVYTFVWPTPVTLTAHGWTISQPSPATTGLVGQYESMAIVDGNPAMSYYDFANANLMYVRALDQNGANWGTPITVDGASSDRGWFTSLAVVNGQPAISYTGSIGISSSGMYYVRANDSDGTSWGSPITLTGSRCFTTSMAVVNGNPAIAVSSGGGDYYIRATNANGSAWGSFVFLANGDYPSLQIVNGNPAVGFYGNGVAGYVRANDANGGSWGGAVTADAGGADDVGYYASLAVVNGNPAISHYDDSTGDLRYVRANDANGSSWGSPLVLDAAGNTGAFGWLAVINSRPAISYFDVSNGALRYISAVDASGGTWNVPLTLDPGNAGDFSTLPTVNGQPGIAYYDGANFDLKFIRFYP